jgi:hypothetical protein
MINLLGSSSPKNQENKMKVSVKELKRIIREYIELSPEEAREKLSSLPSGDITDEEWVDADSGEIYLNPGDSYGKHPLHPEFISPTRQRSNIDLDDDEVSDSSAHNKWTTAVQEYVENWTDYGSNAAPGEDELQMDDEGDLQGVAMDAADSFFSLYPQWKGWSVEMGMSRSEMKSAISEFIYTAMITGESPKIIASEARRKRY